MLLEQSDGSVILTSGCPWKDCKHRFVIRWSTSGFKEHTSKEQLIPPFKKMNGQMFLSIQRHMKEEHVK